MRVPTLRHPGRRRFCPDATPLDGRLLLSDASAAVTPSPGFIGPLPPPVVPAALYPPPGTGLPPYDPGYRKPFNGPVALLPISGDDSNTDTYNKYFNYNATQWNSGLTPWPFVGPPPAVVGPNLPPTLPGPFAYGPMTNEPNVNGGGGISAVTYLYGINTGYTRIPDLNVPIAPN